MTRVKICGITSLDDALAAADAGADAVGFVFTDSPRQISPAAAGRIIHELPPFVRTFGVFRDTPLEQLEAALAQSGVDVAQLHGDESPEYCRLPSRPVLKRFHVAADDTPETLRRRVAGYDVSSLLLDPGAGSGRAFPWELARGLGVPLVIAGGLTPQNVAEAVRVARPYAVDVASGVEDAPGRKNPAAMQAFVRAVREEDAILANC